MEGLLFLLLPVLFWLALTRFGPPGSGEGAG